MALPILNTWQNYFSNPHEGLGSSYERIILNDLLERVSKTYGVHSVLESPCFGFTGISGINSFYLYLKGCTVTLNDHDAQRIALMQNLMQDLHAEIKIDYLPDYTKLPYADDSFDMSWNFSALWFAGNLSLFLHELCRVTSRVILLCVPNQHGLGYKWQKAHADIPTGISFNEGNISPTLIRHSMRENGWKEVDAALIDCPLWPDIGMSKESWLGSLLGKNTETNDTQPNNPVSILPYYRGEDDGFATAMRKYGLFERYAPLWFKRKWSHHYWMLFEPLA